MEQTISPILAPMPVLYFARITSADWPTFAPLIDRLHHEQRARISALRQQGDRARSLCVHLLARVLACAALQTKNTALCFAFEKHGKPVLVTPPGFHFSLSHTKGAVAIAAANVPVGVDIEQVASANMSIAKRFFTPEEQTYLLPEEERDRRFFEIWTRKEAYVKNAGTGIATTSFSSFEVLSGSHIAHFQTLEQDEYLLSVYCESTVELHFCALTPNQICSLAQELMPLPSP